MSNSIKLTENDKLRLQNLQLRKQVLALQLKEVQSSHDSLFLDLLKHHNTSPEKVEGYDLDNGIITIKQEKK